VIGAQKRSLQNRHRMCDLHVVLSVNMQENDMKISLRQIFDRTVMTQMID